MRISDWSSDVCSSDLQRREERLQDVPLSISAVSGDALEKAGTSNIEGLATFTPSLTYAEFNASDPNIYIRGIGLHFDGGSLERSVAVFVDDVYLGRAAGGTADIFDLERVEVLRGPQGTLFGKNTVGEIGRASWRERVCQYV